MVYLKKYFLILIIFLLIACSNNAKNTTSIPQWYINPPLNSSTFIYGTSVSSDLKEAKLIALEDMSNKLIVQIDSTFTSSTNIYNNFYEKELSKNIKQKSKNIIFTNYKTVKSKNINNEFYILLKVNKIDLFNSYKNKLDILNKNINSKYKSIKNYPKLEQINILENLKLPIKKAKEFIYILNALKNNFSYNLYLQVYSNIISKISNLKQNLKVQVFTNSNTSFFKNTIIKVLNKSSYKIVNDSYYDVKINIHNKTIYSKIHAWNIVKVNTNINIISNKKVIKTHIINSLGRSSSNKQSALINASKDFYKKILIKNLFF